MNKTKLVHFFQSGLQKMAMNGDISLGLIVLHTLLYHWQILEFYFVLH